MSSAESYKRGDDGFDYKLHQQPATWDRAKIVCELEGAQLAEVQSGKTFNYIQDSFHPEQTPAGIWIGGRDVNSKGEWRYESA